MRRANRNGGTATSGTAPRTVRVAIYCRQSVATELEFGSIQAQREAVEAYVASQRECGWVALPEHYDDAGISGATTERPALQRLLQDVAAGRVDVVATYKIDRLSRSLLDFARLVELFERHSVAFCSITQQFSTANSMGRFTLNILMSFAEFERETIAERTRDKIRASRRRGLFTGGRPVLGYDAADGKLVVNRDEAELVREIFRLYQDLGSLTAVAAELNRRGARNKTLVAKNGRRHLGREFDKTSVSAILRNPLYAGLQRLAKATFPGAHEAIVDRATFDAVQAQLASRRRDGGAEARNKWGALLKGLARCGACGSALAHHYTRAGNKLHRYYVCGRALKQGAAACPGSRASAGELERLVVDRIRGIGRDPAMVERVAAAMREEANRRLPEITAELRRLHSDASRLTTERENLLAAVAQAGPATHVLTRRLSEVDEQVETHARRRQELHAELEAQNRTQLDADKLRDALAAFDPIWRELYPREQIRVLRLLIEEVTYDARTAEVSIRFQPGGVQALAGELGGAPR